MPRARVIRRPVRRAASDPGGPSWREWVPSWLQAIAAIIAILIPLLGINAVLSRDDVAEAVASVTTMQHGPDGVRSEGDYRALRIGEEEIFIIGRPGDDAEADQFTTVRAQRTPTETDEAAGTEDGTWTARMPIDITEPWTFQVLIARAGVQGIDDPGLLEELRTSGPDASVVLHASDPVTVDPND